MSRTEKILLLIFPTLYLLIGFYFRQVFGDLSLRSFDPDYIHFISGLSVSAGRFSDANIDQPASVLHLLLAFIFRVVYFFRSHQLPYFEDVIKNSDLYLATANLVITTIVAVSLFWAGKSITRISKNVLYGILIQTAPFTLEIWYDIMARIYVEVLFVIPILILEVMLFKELYEKQKYPYKTLWYGITIGLGLSMKMTFLPFLFLPLFVIEGVWRKLKYLIFSVISFFFFSLPVLVQFHRFTGWMKGLFFHNGIYQSGEETIINTSVFSKNIVQLIHAQSIFFYVFLGFIALFFVVLFTKKIKNIYTRINASLLVVILGFFFFMGKHYEMRYFIPALLLFPFVLILMAKEIELFIPGKAIKIILNVILILAVGYVLKQRIPYIRVVSKSVSGQMAARIKTRNVINTLPNNSYKIIVSKDYGSPLQEYSIMYSFCMGGKNWPDYNSKLNKLYPNTYQYFTWDNSLKYWGKKFDQNEVAKSGKPIYLYLEKNNKKLLKKAIYRFFPDSNFNKRIITKLIFENPVNGEGVVQLVFPDNKSSKNK